MRWPDRPSVLRALGAWALRQVRVHPELIRLGYWGSFARDDWGFGSDLDLIAVVRDTKEPQERRTCDWDHHLLPVPVDFVVYTEKEWDELTRSRSRFSSTIARELVWLVSADRAGPDECGSA